MATSSTRAISLTFTGDAPGNAAAVAGTNASSPAESQPVALAGGDNAIAIPGGGATPTAVTIVKPVGNTVQLKLKGANADTGIPLHLTDPDSVSLGAGAVVVLNAGGPVNVRLIWS
jgi:hypothetical protein